MLSGAPGREVIGPLNAGEVSFQAVAQLHPAAARDLTQGEMPPAENAKDPSGMDRRTERLA